MKPTSILFFVLWSMAIFAQDSEKTSFVSLEIDPAPFILKGYSFSLKYSPKKLSKVAFMGSVFSSEYPNSMMANSNKDKGWRDLKFETSYAIFSEFYCRGDRRGFYYGPALFFYNKSVELSSTNQTARFSTLYPNIRAGYIWYPFKTVNLYLNPWLNLGSEINMDKNNSLNGVDFEPNKFNWIIALHIGYNLTWK